MVFCYGHPSSQQHPLRSFYVFCFRRETIYWVKCQLMSNKVFLYFCHFFWETNSWILINIFPHDSCLQITSFIYTRTSTITPEQKSRPVYYLNSQESWTARRSNQSILKEISPEYSLEELMLKLKLQYFGYLIRRLNSLEKTLMLGKTEGRRRWGWDGWMVSPTQWTWIWASSGNWWWTGKPGML